MLRMCPEIGTSFFCSHAVYYRMIATLEYVERKFHEFNAQIFHGALRPLPFRLSSARTFLGQLRYRRKLKFFGGWEYSDFQLVISTNRDMDERLLEDTIIHEMIHYYILSNQLKDTSAHGRIFRQMMTEINRDFSRNITISHRSAAGGEREYKCRRNIVCVSYLFDGRVGVTLVPTTKIFQMWDDIPKMPGVARCAWYVSTDKFFCRFRRSLTPKIYLVDKGEMERLLLDATPLVREGNRIVVAREHPSSLSLPNPQ